jgi:D-alanyl-D-alanine carboxypeptidase
MPAFVALALAFALAADAVAATSQVDPSAPPAQLTCLARHYNLTSAFERGAWFAALPDGARVPWDDGKSKTFDARLDAPDLKDIFLIPYRAGPIRAVEIENEDPGRVRCEAILVATYGSPAKAAAEQVRIRFLGLPVRVHRRISPALAGVAERLAQARQADTGLDRFLRRLSGGFAARKIAGTERTSAHAFGIAIDLDKSQSDYWRWQKQRPLRWRNRFPQAIVDAFEAEGFVWGGRWYHYDTMHFEYRPELFGPPCREPVSAVSDKPPR